MPVLSHIWSTCLVGLSCPVFLGLGLHRPVSCARYRCWHESDGRPQRVCCAAPNHGICVENRSSTCPCPHCSRRPCSFRLRFQPKRTLFDHAVRYEPGLCHHANDDERSPCCSDHQLCRYGCLCVSARAHGLIGIFSSWFVWLSPSAALNVGDKCGSIDVGKQADFVLLNTPHWEHIIYEMGDLTCIQEVFKLGERASKLVP